MPMTLKTKIDISIDITILAKVPAVIDLLIICVVVGTIFAV